MPIHKVEIKSSATAKSSLPSGAKILRSGVQLRDGKPVTVVWYDTKHVDPDSYMTTVKFASVPTGGNAPKDFIYIGTTQVIINDTEVVQHQFVDSKSAQVLIDGNGSHVVIR